MVKTKATIKLLTFIDFLRPLFSGLSSSKTIEPFIPPNIRAIEVDIMHPGMEDQHLLSSTYAYYTIFWIKTKKDISRVCR